jgi:hypothetical protein
LLGIALDVSGSMKQSIRNKNDQDDNGVIAFCNSLKDLSKKVKQEIEAKQKEGIIISIDVFAQAFGLKEVENCDLLTLIELGKEFDGGKSRSSSEFIDPYDELESIGRENGVTDILGFSSWIKEALPDREQAKRLALRLRDNPRFAKHLARLMPKDMSEALKVASTYWMKKNTPFGYLANSVEPKKTNEQLAKAKDLACELANAASNAEIRQIVVREIGSQLGQELIKRGNRLKPLNELAELLESKGDEIEYLEALIYGKTPMTGALDKIQQRFTQELKNLPKNTTSVLFILSDGEPTDGDPSIYTRQLKRAKTYIISCFLTKRNIIEPRQLFNTTEIGWSKEACLMFYMASEVERDSFFVEALIERKWKVPLRPRLFIQANHTDLLNEFTQIIVSLCN